MPELVSLSSVKSVVDPAWYLATYLDVAAAGVDPHLHYEQQGHAEGRFPRPLQACRLEAALWGGFAHRALVELKEWWTQTDDPDERAYASWALARWYATASDWPAAMPFISRLAGKLPSYLGHLGPVLLCTEVLLRNDCQALAKTYVQQAIGRHGRQADLCLAAANARLPTRLGDEESESELRLIWLNLAWAAADLVPVTRRNMGAPLSLDNLKVELIPPSPRGRQPKISVIMPAFNAEEFIETALHSLLRQSWRNLEIIVVDDCSTDATVERVSAMARNDARIRLLCQPRNRGAYAARNVALQQATGDLLTNHDSDDWSHPQRLELMARPLLKDRKLIGTLADWVRADNGLHFQCWRISDSLIEPSVSTIMLRREAVCLLGGWDEVRVAADYELYRRLLRCHGGESIVHVKPGVPLVIARQLPASLTMAPATHLRSTFFGLRNLYSELAETWHDMAEAPTGLCLPIASSRRPFPAPAPMLCDTRVHASYDWLLISDLSSDARAAAATQAVLDRLLASGARVALFHWPDYRRPSPIDRIFLRYAVEGRVDIVLAEQQLDARSVLVVGRHLLAHPLDQVPRLSRLNGCQVIDSIREAKALSIRSGRIDDTPPDLFHADWYLQRYPDVRQAGVDPWQHYLTNGAAEGRDPGPDFNTARYLEQCPQALNSGMPVLLHYLNIGRNLGYDASHPTFTGCQTHRSGRATVLLCAHAANEQLFGAERCLLDVLDAYVSLELNVVVSVPSAVNADYIGELRARARLVVCIPTMPWHVDIAPCSVAMERFSKIIHAYEINVVHANTIMLREPLLAARQAGIPSVIHIHESPAHDAALCEAIGMPAPWIVAEVLERVDHVLANSEFTAQHFAKPGATHVIGNIIDPNAFDLPNPVDPQLITAALISSNLPKKGLQDLVELARNLASDTPNLQLMLIGPENTHVQALRRAQTRGELPNNLRLMPYTSTPEAAIAQANIVLNLSHCQETFGRTILEGMAARRPVLAYHWGALPELIDEGVNGFTVEHGDIQAMASRLRQFCREPHQITAIGKAGREHAMRHNLQRLGEQLAQAYALILRDAIKVES